MITGVFKLYRLLVKTMRGEDSPRQVAMGIALGMVVGLIPVDSLLSVAVATLIMATRVNLLSAILSGFCFVWLGHSIDPLLHRVGAFILTADFLQPTWTWLYERPVVPWTRFNNTVVMGSLALSAALFYPVFQISEALMKKYGPILHRRLLHYAIYRKLAGVKTKPEVTTS